MTTWMAALAVAALGAAPESGPALVLVVGPDGSQSSADLAREADLRDALRAEGQELVDVSERFPSVPATSVATDLVAKAKLALDALDLEQARSLLDDALARVVSTPAGTSAQALAELHLLRAAVASQLGGKNAAKDVHTHLLGALAADPQVKPDPKLFSPELSKQLAKAEAELAARPKGALAIEGGAGGAVELRGALTLLPSAPPPVPEGPHVVTIAKPGFEHLTLRVDVKAPITAVAALLTPTPAYDEARKAAAAALAAPAGPQARTLAAKAKARWLVLADSGGALQAIDASSGRVAFSGPLGPPGVTAQALKKALTAPSVSVVKASPPPPPPSVSPVTSKPWFWVAVGVVAGAAVASTVALTASGRPFNPTLGF